MRLLRHLYEAEEEKKEEKEKKPEKGSDEEAAMKNEEEKDKAIERFVKMILAAVQPSMLNMVVQQVSPLYVKWGDDWLNKLDAALKETISDRLRTEFIKIVKNLSVRFHHIKPDGGKAKDDETDMKNKNKKPDEEDEK